MGNAIVVLALILALSVAVSMAIARRQPGRASWPAMLLCFLGRRILALRYRVHIEGTAIARQRGTRGTLFLPNHPALIDPVIVIAFLHGKFGVRPLALADQIDAPVVRAMANLIGVLRVPCSFRAMTDRIPD